MAPLPRLFAVPAVLLLSIIVGYHHRKNAADAFGIPCTMLHGGGGRLVMVRVDDDRDDQFSWRKRTRIKERRAVSPSLPTSSFVLYTSSSSTNEADGDSQQQSTPEEQLITSWLNTHLPTLPLADLQSYTSYLYNDGFTTLEQLNSINSGNSGKVEDLYFMKKGHRRVLMKKIGIMRTSRMMMEGSNSNSNNQGMARGDRESGSTPLSRMSGGGGGDARNTQKQQQQQLQSRDGWIAEQNRLVEERRKKRLAEEEKWRKEYAAAYNTSSLVAMKEKEGAGYEDDGLVVSDFEARYQTLEKLPTDDHGTALKQARRLKELKREFLERAAKGRNKEGEESVLDDVNARYQSLDIAHDSKDPAKEARRLEEIKSEFLNKQSNHTSEEEEVDFVMDDLEARYQSVDTHNSQDAAKEARRLEKIKEEYLNKQSNTNYASGEEEDSVLDDLAARYQSMDIAHAVEDGGGKQARRLEEIKAFLNKQSSSGYAAEDDVVLDDLAARYSSLDIEAMDAGTRDKESRRLQEIRRAFEKKKRAAQVNRSEGYTTADDFATRYESLDIEAMDRGTLDKATRRLQELKQTYPGKQRDDRAAAYNEEPLRLDLLKRPKEETAKDRKERMRIEQFQRKAKLAAEKKAEALQRKLQQQQRLKEELLRQQELGQQPIVEEQETEQRMIVDNESEDDEGRNIGSSGSSGVTYKTGEERRLEELNRYFNERRAARTVAEKEKKLMLERQRLMNDALKKKKLEEEKEQARLLKLRKEMEMEGSSAHKKNDAGSSFGNEASMKLDDFLKRRPAAEVRSLSTTMPPSNIGATKVGVGRRSPPNNGEGSKIEAAQQLADPTDGDFTYDEECIVGDEEECWDITRRPNFYSRQSQSLATTLPPTNTKSKVEGSSMQATVANATASNDGNASTSSKDKSTQKQNTSDSFYDIQNPFPEGRGRIFQSLATATEAPSSSTAERREYGVRQNVSGDKKEQTSSSEKRVADFLPLTEGLTAEEAEMIRKSRLDGVSGTLPSMKEEVSGTQHEVTEGQTAEQAQEARNARLAAADKAAKSFTASSNIGTETVASRVQEDDLAAKKDVVSKTSSSPSMEGLEAEKEYKARLITKQDMQGKTEDPNAKQTLMAKEEEAEAPPLAEPSTNGKASALYQRLLESKRRLQSPSFDEGEKPVMKRRTLPVARGPHIDDLPSWSRQKPRSDRTTATPSAGTSISDDSLYLDITSRFPDSRPSSVGVKRRDTAILGSDQGSTTLNRNGNDDSHLDISNFPKDRPSLSVNTGMSKVWTTTGSYHERKSNDGYDDSTFIDSIAQNFSRDRASLVGHLPPKKVEMTNPFRTKRNTIKPSLSQSQSQSQSTGLLSRNEDDAGAGTRQFLDKPRPFHSDVDFLSSNMSGAQFKRSRDNVPESTLESKVKQPKPDSSNSLSLDGDPSFPGSNQSEEEVMSWLLTHLPELNENDAISYFNHLVEEGFDSIDGLDEITPDDLSFMKRGHQRVLLNSVHGVGEEDSDANKEIGIDNTLQNDNAKDTQAQTLADTIDQTMAELKEVEAWIAEQNRQAEEHLAERLVDDDEEEGG